MEADDGKSTSRREWELVNVSIRGGHSTGNTEELVVGSSVGGGKGEVRDWSESEVPNKACASTFFLHVALDGSGSVAVLAPTLVSILNSSGVLVLLPEHAAELLPWYMQWS